ncbi:MAG: ParB N-terminal domain-containing protein [Candidatus Aminicenantes bacterium]|nr:ParB N-terminal domain-containing protein [Candidatus Aminicenantes bacterium]
MKLKKVDLKEINLQDRSFRYTLKPVDDRLLFSIREAGIVEPVVVMREGKHYIPVTGFRRLEAAAKLELSFIPVIELEKTVTRLEAFWQAFFANYGWRAFSLAEKSLAVKKFLEFGLGWTEIVEKVLVWLDLPPTGRTVEILTRLAEEENLLPVIHEKNWKISAVERIFEFPREERAHNGSGS